MRSIVHLNFAFCESASIQVKQLKNWNVIEVNTMAAMTSAIEEFEVSVCMVTQTDIFDVKHKTNLEDLIKQYPCIEWVAILASKLLHLSSVRSFIRDYFYDYHRLPIELTRLSASLGHAYGMANLKVDNKSHDASSPSLQIIGASEWVKEIKLFLGKIASSEASVLITGESGTGKELVAKTIHSLSDRADKSFVAINCGAIPVHLIQSELFGHEKGAFTGAHKLKIGRIEAANNGTLFLDEIGDLPLPLQVNFLRVLQEGKIERVGGNDTILLDIRVISATNINLEKAIVEGEFRQDLYYRLNVLNIGVPPLRDRQGDAKLLANHFLKQLTSHQHRSITGFNNSAETMIASYSWPGNIRELINRVKRAVILCESAKISLQDLGFDAGDEKNINTMTLACAREQADKSIIELSLACTDHNISAASRLLNISRLSLYRLMNKYAVESKKA